MENFSFKELPVVIYGKLTRYNDVLSKARCRIFYKYANRNGTYITDDFSEKLLNTVSYTPVKGIYEVDDYTDHGEKRSEGRIYGIVPENANLIWETHTDEDGKDRLYACVDVLIFTGLYTEATEIVGKALSMELFEPTLKYHFEIKEGQKYLVFEEGSFLGLQVLGEDVEPCFEGASFYSLQNSIQKLFALMGQEDKGGQLEVPEINFKLSDNDKYRAIWALLNDEYTEAGNWTQTYGLGEIYEDYALAYNLESGETLRVYYSKDDKTDSVAITEKKKCYVVDVTEEEKTTLDTLRQLNGGTYELVSDCLTNAQKNLEDKEQFSLKIEELNNSITTLTSERDNFSANYTTEQEKVSTLTGELESLKNYKLQQETEKKTEIIASYSELLSKEIIDTYTEKMADYEVIELDKELAYELKKTNSAVFTAQPGLILKDMPSTGLDAILTKYIK